MHLNKFKRARLESGLRQLDLARRVGITESYVSRIETGRVEPDTDLAARIATVLAAPPESLGIDVASAGGDGQ